jgi:hypothetical protein
MSISRPALVCAILALGLAPLAVRAEEETAPPARPRNVPKAELTDVGKHKNVPKPKHFGPGPNDKPVCIELYDFFQRDQQFAELFNAKGGSEICEPTSLANILAFLKYKHEPKYPKICEKTLKEVEKDNKHASNEFDMVDAMFKLCHTNKQTGTGFVTGFDGAKEALAEGGYGHDIYAIAGYGEGKNKRAPTPQDLREIRREGKMAMLGFGWYDLDWDAKNHKWKYKRGGGHAVAYAGYDANDPLVIYICNPEVDYKTEKHFSRLFLWPTPNEPGYVEGCEHCFQTEDLGSALAVLEQVIVIAPK